MNKKQQFLNINFMGGLISFFLLIQGILFSFASEGGEQKAYSDYVLIFVLMSIPLAFFSWWRYNINHDRNTKIIAIIFSIAAGVTVMYGISTQV